ncbi:MAG TPA: thioredoxin [Bacteroidaceae bacterium]|nr:thioredoxin [Bacteroidaceae bacterium]
MELEITEKNFDAIIADSKPVLIDFWASWCGPCRRLAPIIEELAVEYEGKAIIGKCNIEESTQLPERFGIMSIPTVLLFKDGKIIDRQIGAADKSVYQQKINALL